MIRSAVLIGCAALLILGSASYAGDEKQPFIGVLLSADPLPDLLTKHLGLESGQGLRVVNISVGSSADRAGLERDDIITTFCGEKARDLDQFVALVQKAGIGAKVAIEVIHLGQRRTVEFVLEAGEKMEWKYPSEPEVVMSWRPGKVFKIGPDGDSWVEIPADKLPEFNLDGGDFFRQVYTYEYTTDGEKYIITIEGDPNNNDSKVTVRAGEAEHSATVGGLDQLPEKYRQAAKEAVASARENWRTVRIQGTIHLPQPPRPEVYQKYLDEVVKPDMDRLSEQKDRALEMLQEQIGRLQERMKQLEDHNRELLNQLLNKTDQTEPQSDHTQGPAPSQPEGESGV
jgi:hypothetical protein